MAGGLILDKLRFLTKFSRKRSLLVLLACVLLLTVVLPVAAKSQANAAEKQKVVRGVARTWIQVGKEQAEAEPDMQRENDQKSGFE